jgi:hypothetical protein
MTTTLTVGSARLMTLGRRHLFVLLFGLTSLAVLVAWAALSPEMYAYYCEQHYIPSVAGKFGFEARRLPVPGYEDELLGVSVVEPGGVFDRAGFRAGDIPVDHHGGLTRLCVALQLAEDGEAARVVVINAAEWATGYRARRELAVPPVARSR